DRNQFILADMPGLIKGAHEGKGLGIQFLRHIERCRVLIHVVSMDGERDPYTDYLTINEELKDYGAGLEERPQIVVASKMDCEGAEERKAEFDKKTGIVSYGISALTDDGVEILMKKAYELVTKTPEFKLWKGEEETGGMKVYDAHVEAAKAPFILSHPKDFLWIISGEKVMNHFAMINLTTDEGVAKLISYLNRIGVDEELRKRGAKNGDNVMIGDFQFEYND
ncbi:MAG: Obg family GTPase CgtA, partial [Bacilli bacterium]|nr:Obg family GTPase CgtA [Bacilli bacterium]